MLILRILLPCQGKASVKNLLWYCHLMRIIAAADDLIHTT